ncbi:helix-turn-helix transcriptional regulator [Labilibaculum sp. K2S]|nr:helix-turn-helix transcriptional regulator [Labilibaculum sp. K2S]
MAKTYNYNHMKNLIKVERAKKDITQAGLAECIQVSRQTINAIEKGKFIPSTMLALKMARFFECTVEDIFILEEGD